MRLKNSFCLANEYIKPQECDRLIKFCDRLPAKKAGTAKGADPSGLKRRSSIAWFEDTPNHKWIYDRVSLCVKTANEQYWHWTVNDNEPLQYTTYGSGQYYGWHTDASHTPYPKASPWAGMVRKISVTVQLSHPHEYEGGNFLLEDTRTSPDRAEDRIKTLSDAKNRGTVIMFPSHLFHQVTPVTRGTRRSLVGWYLGPQFQ